MDDFSQFHFLRPYLLWLFIPAIALIYYLKQNKDTHSNWEKIISPHLFQFLVRGEQTEKKQSHIFLISLLISLLIISISGPSFREKPIPVLQPEYSRVLVLDLSLSMNAEDIKPSRLERAKFKLLDILKQIEEGSVALVVYAGDAFIISPLTTDSNTVANMVPSLSTGLMPVLGSRPDLGIKKAIELLKNANHSKGEIIWLTDGVTEKSVEPIIDSLKQTDYQLSILGVGSEQGAPIPLPNKQGFLKDNQGNIIIPKYETQHLQQIVEKVQAGYIKLTANQDDLSFLKRHRKWQLEQQNSDFNQQAKISQWIDDGYWLIWVILALFLFQLIRHSNGHLLSFLLTVFSLSTLLYPQPSNAFSWDDLWLTKDQQARKAYEKGDYEKSAELFTDKDWQAISTYKQGDFETAAEKFDPEESITSHYNHATSLAKSKKLQEALESYNSLLEKQPDHQDALQNKKIVEELIKQQNDDQQKDNQQDNNQQNQDNENSDQNKQNQDSSQQQDQSSDQQESKDQSESEQTESEKESSEKENSQEESAEQNNQSDEEKTEQEQKQAKAQQADEKETEKTQEQMAKLSEEERKQSEQDQALEQWLNKIPDDPGGLLRQKMIREYQRRKGQQTEEIIW